MKKSCFSFLFLILPALIFLPACSIKKIAMNQVANALTGSSSSTVFSGDNDPELVGDALPFAIKMYESLLAANPGHQGLRLQTGSLYIMYANAFLQTPAVMLPEAEYKKQKFVYLAGKKLVFARPRHPSQPVWKANIPGFREALHKRNFKQALQNTTGKDAPMLYWAGAGWLGAYAIDPFDMDLGMTMPAAAALMDRVVHA